MTDNEPNYFIADKKKLIAAIDATGKSKSAIASAGELSKDTLNKALRGLRITRTKANGIVNGLDNYGVAVDKR